MWKFFNSFGTLHARSCGNVDGPGERRKGDVDFVRGGWSVDNAVVVAPLADDFVDVVIVRGCGREAVCC